MLCSFKFTDVELRLFTVPKCLINIQIALLDCCYHKLVALIHIASNETHHYFLVRRIKFNMLNCSKKISSRSSVYQLIAATLTIGVVSLLMPTSTSAQVLTPAGTPINNTATVLTKIPITLVFGLTRHQIKSQLQWLKLQVLPTFRLDWLISMVVVSQLMMELITPS